MNQIFTVEAYILFRQILEDIMRDVDTVDALSCDSTRTNLLLHHWVWSRQLKKIFMQTYNSIHDTRFSVKVRLTSEARGPIYWFVQTSSTISQKVVTETGFDARIQISCPILLHGWPPVRKSNG